MAKVNRIAAPPAEQAYQAPRRRWRPNWIRIAMLAFCLGFWWLLGWSVVHGLEMIHVW
jgi:hypothetical protein